MRRAAAFVLIGALGLLWGCERGPSGPGVLDVSVEGADLGAAVVVLSGSGIQGVQPGPGVQTFAGPGGVGGGLRVLVVRQGAGPLRFGVAVADVGAPPPSGSVLSAVDGENRPLAGTGGLTVRVSGAR